MNYREYRPTAGQRLQYMLEAAGITGIVALCFYNSLWAVLLFPAVLWKHEKERRGQTAKRRRKELKLQFRDAVQGLAAALAAGYSAENALREAGRDLKLMYAADADMVQELSAMERKLDANQTIEQVMEDFAGRSGLEEAEVFAEIFSVGKRSGGDLIKIMGDTAVNISDTVETERQVSSALAARRYEQRIMNVIPFAMVLYLRVGCPGFLDPLYGNLPGICVMTACLGLYLGAWYLGKRLLDIEV